MTTREEQLIILRSPVRRHNIREKAFNSSKASNAIINLSRPEQHLLSSLRLSKSWVRRIKQPVSIGIVFSMWRESKRISPRSAENPHGEGCIADKLDALGGLFLGTNIDWHLYAIDDGCPEQSADAALSAKRIHPLGSRVSVLQLSQAFPFKDAPLSLLPDAAHSQKGGAILYGMREAKRAGHDFIAYTDCDNSVDLGQVGLLLGPCVVEGLDLVVGDRFLPESFMGWDQERPTERDGARILSHIRRTLLKTNLKTLDPPSPFKLFRANVIDSILNDIVNFNFVFDFDILIAAEQHNLRQDQVPYVYIDSFEESTWNSYSAAELWHDRIHGIIRAAQKLKRPLNYELVSIVESYLTHPSSVEVLLCGEAPLELRMIPDAEIGQLSLMNERKVKMFISEALTRNDERQPNGKKRRT